MQCTKAINLPLAQIAPKNSLVISTIKTSHQWSFSSQRRVSTNTVTCATYRRNSGRRDDPDPLSDLRDLIPANVDSALQDAQRLAEKYLAPGSSGTTNKRSSPLSRKLNSGSDSGGGMGNGIFSLLLINFALHSIAYIWSPSWMSSLALSHWRPQWWQFATAAFIHANWEHLLGNAFSLLVFGRMVEEEEGAFGVWCTYLICGIGGNLASYIASPHTRTLSLGASSAVFGLFVVGVLSKLRPSVKRLLEAFILGSFVVKQVLQEVSMVSGGKAVAVVGNMSVGHWAHLGGAAAGVLLVLLLSRLPYSPASDDY